MNKLLFLILLPLAALAQQEDVPPPPFVVNAPAYACWSVTYKPKVTRSPSPKTGNDAAAMMQGQAKPLQRELKKITVTKAGAIRRIVSTWSDGTASEQGIIPGFQLLEQPGQEGVYLYTSSALSHSIIYMEDYTKTDFPEFGWLSDKNYSGVESFNKTKCWSFQGTFTSGMNSKSLSILQALEKNGSAGSESKPARGVQRKAWIDIDTKLPAAMDDGMKIHVFTFYSAPTEPPEMPARFAKAVNDYKKNISALENKYRMLP